MSEFNKELLQELSQLKAPDCVSLDVLEHFLDGKGQDDERQQLDAHIRACPWCVNRLNELQEIDFLAQKGEKPPADVVEAVKRMLTEPDSQPVSVPQRFQSAWESVWEWLSPSSFGGYAAAAAAAAVLIVVGT